MSSTPSPTVSFVIPAYNEERRLPESLQILGNFLERITEPVEIIVVVEKSLDDTLAVAHIAAADDERVKVIGNDVQKGKGYAVRCGMLEARGELIFFMDADLSTSLSEISVFLQHFKAHPETHVLIGSRALASSHVERPQSFLRRSMGVVFNRIVRLFAIAEITDTQCGFKAFRRDAALEIFKRQKLNGFSFDVELLLLAKALDYQVEVKPVRWLNSPDSRVRIAADSLLMLRDLILVRGVVRRSMRQQPVVS